MQTGRGAICRLLTCLGAFLFLLLMPGISSSQGIGDLLKGGQKPSPDEPVTIRTVWSQDKAHAGDQIHLALVVDMVKGWHIWPDAAQVASSDKVTPIPTEVAVAEIRGDLVAEPVRYPKPHLVKVDLEEGELPAFENGAVFYIPVQVNSDAIPGRAVIGLDFSFQACNEEVCQFPKSVKLKAAIEIVSSDVAINPNQPQLFEGVANSSSGSIAPSSDAVKFDLFGMTFTIDASSTFGLILLLLVALAGGALLNFTPCVLPVIPIKIMALSHSAGNRGRCFALGLSMSGGVVAFWLGLGGVIAAVTGFTTTNQLFQYPAFTISVGVVIAVMAVGMCGLFSIQLPQSVYSITPKHDTMTGSFGFGIMTAVLSTPCTAPFMGAAAAWAASQHPATTLATFASIGLGMAFPYLMLSAKPGLATKMPQSGEAGELIKQVMGLFLLSAAAYFIGVGLSAWMAKAPDPPGTFHWWMAAGLCVAAGGWMAVRTLKIAEGTGKKVLFGGLGLVIAIGSILGAFRLTDEGPIHWVNYTPDRLEKALADGNVVVMDFTAEWCLNCKALEHSVLHTDSVSSLLNSDGVIPMKVDITGENLNGKKKLTAVGRLTIPLLVIFSPSGKEVFKSDFYTVGQILQAVQKAKSSKVSFRTR